MSSKHSRLPTIDVDWLPGRPGKLTFLTYIFLVLGMKGAGKSALLETIAPFYKHIIDLFGSKDNEGLGWCRSKFKDSLLFLTGDSVEVSSDWESKKIRELKLSDFNKYRVVVTVNAFYSTQAELFHSMSQLIEMLWTRTHWQKRWFVMIREAANFIYSRIKVVKSQTMAKADFIYFCRVKRFFWSSKKISVPGRIEAGSIPISFSGL